MALTFNPYPEIGSQLEAGLNAIVAATPATVDDLVDEIYNYIQPVFYPSSSSVPKAIEIEIKSVAYNMINAYNNKALGNTIFYGLQQSNLMSMMLGLTTSSLTPINSLDHWFADIEDNIGKANLTIDQQTPLLLAMECAKTIYAYWVAQVDMTTSPWASYFQATGDRNYPNIPFWTTACIEGALLGANASQKGLIAPTTDITSVNIVSALIGALAIGSGKVIFKWVPRIQPQDLILDSVDINIINGGNSGNFSGFVRSGSDGNGCYDTFDWTIKDVTNKQGEVIGSKKDQDNVQWWKNFSRDTCNAK